jgi:hypothetical protein
MSADRLSVALAEFQALRNETDLKLRMFYQIYVIYFSALGLFYGYIFVNDKTVDLILAIPIAALALFYRLLYDQLMIHRIGNYIRSEISEKQIPAIIDSNPPDCHQNLPAVMQWVQYNRSNPLPEYYKRSLFLVFAVLSVVPPILRNLKVLLSFVATLQDVHIWGIGPVWHNLKIILGFLFGLPCYTALLIILGQAASLAINLSIGLWITVRIFKDEF